MKKQQPCNDNRWQREFLRSSDLVTQHLSRYSEFLSVRLSVIMNWKRIKFLGNDGSLNMFTFKMKIIQRRIAWNWNLSSQSYNDPAINCRQPSTLICLQCHVSITPQKKFSPPFSFRPVPPQKPFKNTSNYNLNSFISKNYANAGKWVKRRKLFFLRPGNSNSTRKCLLLPKDLQRKRERKKAFKKKKIEILRNRIRGEATRRNRYI